MVNLKIEKLPAWFLINFYNKSGVLKCCEAFAVTLFTDSNGKVDVDALQEARV